MNEKGMDYSELLAKHEVRLDNIPNSPKDARDFVRILVVGKRRDTLQNALKQIQGALRYLDNRENLSRNRAESAGIAEKWLAAARQYAGGDSTKQAKDYLAQMEQIFQDGLKELGAK